jgi:hypothetical protein
MPSKIYFDINKVKTWAIENIKDFEGDKWILYESTNENIWCMEWYGEKDQ